MKRPRLHLCNVLESRAAERHLWHFKVDKDQVILEGEQTIVPPAPLPQKMVGRDWRDLFQKKANIAWLPPHEVFLRVVQFPAADRQELLSMLEFQLEKLSPIPVAQAVWSVEILPSKAEKMQTAVVCIVPRDTLEVFVGTLEQQQFQPDRIEVPQLNHILADGVREDGAWIYPGTDSNADICTVAWWAGGTLQQIQLLHLPTPTASMAEGQTSLPPTAEEIASARAAFLRDQLMQIAWAGELEGWLELPVRWRLVADESTSAQWEPLIRALTDEPFERSNPLDRNSLATFSAERAAKGETTSNLLPSEHAARYHQQLIDRLWMRGLGALVVAYTFGVLIYIILLQVYSYRQTRVDAQVAALANTYTNTLQLKERVQVLEEQLNLKYAALDCWKVASENLPEDFTLTWLAFTKGTTLILHGTSPPDQVPKVLSYNEALRNAAVNGKPLFKFVSTPNTRNRPGSPNLSWDFECELNVSSSE